MKFKNQKIRLCQLENTWFTKGPGPDSCIDAVGCEAHGTDNFKVGVDKLTDALGIETDRAYAISQAIMCCRKAGTVSVPGVYVGIQDIPLGAAMNKGLTMKMGQSHVQRYLKPLLKKIEDGEIDPSFVITHRIGLDQAPAAYQTFHDKDDGCVKVVITP